MSNPFETPAAPNIENKDSNLEELVNGFESKTETYFYYLENLSSDFVTREKLKLGITESDPELDQEINKIIEKYSKERKSLRSSFVSKLKKIVKYLSVSLVTLTTVVHFSKKEYPDFLPKNENKLSKKIEWNENTEKEIRKLAKEYALLMKSDIAYRQISDSVFENRFINFVEEYGSDIKIVHPDGSMNLGEKINQFIFSDVLNNEKTRAHYLNKTLFYEEKDLKMKKDSSGYDWESSSINDFFAEFSHHINGDYSWGRSCAWAESLVENKFQQHEMYDDIYSPEFQAHSITQNAIDKYLVPNDHNLNQDFVNIYNIEQEYYREFVKGKKDFEKIQSIEVLIWNLLEGKSFSEITQDKQLVFKNLTTVRGKIDTLKVNKEAKQRLFEVIISAYNLSDAEQNFDQLVDEVKEILSLIMSASDPNKGHFSAEEIYIKSLIEESDSYENMALYFEGQNPSKAQKIKKILNANESVETLFKN